MESCKKLKKTKSRCVNIIEEAFYDDRLCGFRPIQSASSSQVPVYDLPAICHSIYKQRLNCLEQIREYIECEYQAMLELISNS